MTTTYEDRMTTTQVYRVYIKTTADRIWDAITKPEWTVRYGYSGAVDFDLRPGGHAIVTPTPEFKAASEAQGYPCPDVLIDGEILEADPPNRLVQTWRMLMDPELAAEGFTRLTHEIKDLGNGTCRLTVTHELEGAPKLALLVSGTNEDIEAGGGGGHAWVLSDLKSLLETGKGFNEQ
jgi:uncharacterized protein YndB with AHSA1/START domain